MRVTHLDILPELILSLHRKKMTPKLEKLLEMMIKYLVSISKFKQYRQDEEMQSLPMQNLKRCWDHFDPKKGHNVCAYFSQVIRSSFCQHVTNMRRKKEASRALDKPIIMRRKR